MRWCRLWDLKLYHLDPSRFDLTAMSASLYPLVAVIYGAVATYFWRGSFTIRQEPTSVVNKNHGNWARWLVLAGILLHGAILYSTIFGTQGLNLGLGNALSLIVGLTVLIYWIGSWLYPIASLQQTSN